MLNKKISIFFLIFLSIIFADKKFSVNSKTENKISILFELKDYSIDKINGEDRISLNNEPLSIDIEPVFSTFIHIDSDKQYNVIFEENSIDSYNFQNNIYSENISESYYEVKEHIMRGRKLIELIISPFKFNDDLNRLDITNDISINIELVDNNKNYNNQSIQYSKSFDELINNISLNEIDLNRDWEYQKPSVLYICDPDIGNNPYLQGLVNWRKQQGYEVTLVTTNDTGNSTSSIKSFVEDAYFEWENPPEFLCLYHL